MSKENYQSPISPGRSWYEDSCGERPTYAPLDGETSCDVAIIGGGFCGLSAALHLAEGGTNVVLLEAHRIGDGASGRNGGQMGSGQRADILELEEELGFQRAKALWDLAEDAKHSLLQTAYRHNFTCDFAPGQLTPVHKSKYEDDCRREVEALATRFGYDEMSYLDQQAMAEALGSGAYFGGTNDVGTGHIHPMKYLIGLASAAHHAGAQLHEQTAATAIEGSSKSGSRFRIKTKHGTISANACLLAMNGHHGDLRDELAAHVLPLQSFIGATEPLPDDTPVLPGGQAVDDSRFVVRYFRKSADNRLLFGGREAYGAATPKDIEKVIRRQITEIYPYLHDVAITHAWGGSVAITMPRMPYVRELEPGLWTAGGFSGHGVMMSNYAGRLLAEHLLDGSEQLKLLLDLKIPAFPGGKLLRHPLKVLALTWYSLLDRL
ncbi:MAG: FAD-binding oxidoreductase [Ahrensia sp.]|nr:FAD-binding oxidoreductase [Ahrensia sp.]